MFYSNGSITLYSLRVRGHCSITEFRGVDHGYVTLHRHTAGFWRFCFMCLNIILLLSFLIETHFYRQCCRNRQKIQTIHYWHLTLGHSKAPVNGILVYLGPLFTTINTGYPYMDVSQYTFLNSGLTLIFAVSDILLMNEPCDLFT